MRSKRSSTHSFPIAGIRRRLLRWYKQNKRGLPWRETRNPYAIWVAETMLQQTQVQTVLPYYRRFLRAFPTLNALDRAPLQKVLALWSGLGYYRRAENLKKAARIIGDQHNGRIPMEFNALRALPGIGDYTAGALMSIAFNEPYPAVDGNARRVLKRLFDVREEVELNQVAKTLISHTRPGDFNQALMDLGSSVCVAGKPNCRVCPCSTFCIARMSGGYKIQRLTTHTQQQEITWPLAVILHKGRVLLRRRSEKGLLARLWEIPGGQIDKYESPRRALQRQVKPLGKFAHRAHPSGEIRHSITRFKIRAPVFILYESEGRLPQGNGWRWVPLAALKRYPLSSLTRKAIDFLSFDSRAAEVGEVG